MESEIKPKWDGDSPIERNPQRDGQEGVQANIPRVASTIKSLHLEQKKLSEAARTRLLREKKKAADTGSKKRPKQTAGTSEGATGSG